LRYGPCGQAPPDTHEGMRGNELVLAIRKALKGERYISESLARSWRESWIGDSGKPLHEILSDREYQVMLMIASGKPVGAIAKELCLSAKTISSYRRTSC